jgi:NAD(P)-dependent dehydrogenase (short-subunit alcohol dehydrogenase family)
MSDAFTFEGRHAVVAGVGGPLARPAAVALAEGGATVSLLTQSDDRSQEVEAQSILNECWSLGHDGSVFRLDSTDESAVEAAVDQLEAQLGPMSILVTVLPEPSRAPAVEATRQAWRAEIARSATPIVIPMLVAGRRMLERGEGRIVNVLDASHGAPEANTALFAAAEGAVLALGKALSVEWGSQGIFVRTLIPEASEAASGPHAHAAFRAALRRALLEADRPATEAGTASG